MSDMDGRYGDYRDSLTEKDMERVDGYLSDALADRKGDAVMLTVPAKKRSFPCFYIEKGTVRLDTGLAPDVFFGMFERISKYGGENAV